MQWDLGFSDAPLHLPANHRRTANDEQSQKRHACHRQLNEIDVAGEDEGGLSLRTHAGHEVHGADRDDIPVVQHSGIDEPELYVYKPKITLFDVLEGAETKLKGAGLPIQNIRLEYRMPY